MTSRVTGLLAGALALSPAAAAQRGGTGTVEVAGFARYANFDNTLGMRNTIAVGGQAAAYVGPSLGVELDVARASSNSITHTPAHLRAVYYGRVAPRVEALLGGGYVRNWYGAPYEASDGGLSALLGLRYQATNRVWLRLGADLDFMIHTSNDSPFPFYHGNWGLQFGAGARLSH